MLTKDNPEHGDAQLPHSLSKSVLEILVKDFEREENYVTRFGGDDNIS